MCAHREQPARGSSPLTRGKQACVDQPVHERRLIPAHAGKTDPLKDIPGVKEAHPRSRGENAANSRQSSLVAGSSPLTRGKRRWCPAPAREARLIPAHAGKTLPPTCGTPLCRAHPRSRGENMDGGPQSSPLTGSSPLTRGKPSVRPLVCGNSGLIPAHAGKTNSHHSLPVFYTAHPRSRGENGFPGVRAARS